MRRSVLERLDGADMLVSKLASGYGISLQAGSRHIQVLVSAGLVVQTRTGRIKPLPAECRAHCRGGGLDQPLCQILGCAIPDVGGASAGD